MTQQSTGATRLLIPGLQPFYDSITPYVYPLIRFAAGAILVPNWFSFVFTYKGSNHALEGFFDAIVLVMETGFAVTALTAMLLNLLIGEEVELDAVLECDVAQCAG